MDDHSRVLAVLKTMVNLVGCMEFQDVSHTPLIVPAFQAAFSH